MRRLALRKYMLDNQGLVIRRIVLETHQSARCCGRGLGGRVDWWGASNEPRREMRRNFWWPKAFVLGFAEHLHRRISGTAIPSSRRIVLDQPCS